VHQVRASAAGDVQECPGVGIASSHELADLLGLGAIVLSIVEEVVQLGALVEHIGLPDSFVASWRGRMRAA